MAGPRQLIYKLYSIPYPTRIELLSKLGLYHPGDKFESDREVIYRAIKRAKEEERLLELGSAIESYEKK